MTFRATVRDGLIVINTHGELPDGTTVEVVRAVVKPKAKGRSGGRTSKARATRKKAKDDLPGFGGWAQRTDIKDPVAYARQLRRRVSRRIRRA